MTDKKRTWIDRDRTIDLRRKADPDINPYPYTGIDKDLWSLIQDLVYNVNGVLDDIKFAYDFVSIYPDQDDLDAFTDFGRDALDAIDDALYTIRRLAYVKSGDADKDDLLYGYGGLFGDR